jgi:hypothetical protein
MAVSGTTTNYTGRLLDINVSGSLSPLSSATQSVTYAFGSPTQQLAGVQKLVQRYVISLMNSGFVTALIGAAANNISYAANLFNSYSWGVIQQFKSYQLSNPNTNSDEKLNTVQLLSVSSNGDAVAFSIQLTTHAGTSVTYVLPIPL